MSADLSGMVRPLDFKANFYGDAKAWQADTLHGRFVYGVDFSGKFYTQTPDGETDHASLQSAHDFVHSEYAALVLAMMDVPLLRNLQAEVARLHTSLDDARCDLHDIGALVEAATQAVWDEYQDSVASKWAFRKEHVENAIRRAAAMKGGAA